MMNSFHFVVLHSSVIEQDIKVSLRNNAFTFQTAWRAVIKLPHDGLISEAILLKIFLSIKASTLKVLEEIVLKMNQVFPSLVFVFAAIYNIS